MINVMECTEEQSINALMADSKISERYSYTNYFGMTMEECRSALMKGNKVIIKEVLVIAKFPKMEHFTIKCFWDHCIKIAPFSKKAFVRGAIVHFELENPVDICNAPDLDELQRQFDKALWSLIEMSKFDYRFILSPTSDIQPGRTALCGLPGYR